jgi:hypothetical protein
VFLNSIRAIDPCIYIIYKIDMPALDQRLKHPENFKWTCDSGKFSYGLTMADENYQEDPKKGKERELTDQERVSIVSILLGMEMLGGPKHGIFTWLARHHRVVPPNNSPRMEPGHKIKGHRYIGY